MELYFLLLLVILMAGALGSGFPVAFALPGASIITIMVAAGAGYLFEGVTDAYFAQGGPKQWLSAGVTNLRGVYWEPERDTLIAIPLFIFMGIMLQRSKIAEDLLITMANLFGPVPGGLGISVVFVGALLAATTGIVGATVVAMGLISLPAMMRNGYSNSLATGTIAASGTLGQIIPPSIVLIILADQLASAADQAGTLRKALFKETTGELSMPSAFEVVSTSAGEMFLGALVPGLVLVGLYMIYILVIATLRPEMAPPVRYEGKYDTKFALNVFLTLVPPLALIFLVLGSIIGGIATVNQAGAIGAAGALIMAGYRLNEGRKGTYHPAILALVSLVAIGFIMSNFDTNIKSIKNNTDALGVGLALLATFGLITALVWSAIRAFKVEDTLQGVMRETSKATALVFIILLGAAILTAAFRAFGGEHLVKEFLEGMPGGFWLKFFIVMAVIFFMGFFLDFIEIAVVVVPIVAPILLADPGANVTAVWLGVMIGLNIQTSFLTPPFGFALFYLRGVAPAAVKTIQMYKGVVPFIGLQLIALGIVANAPQLVNYLPNRVALLSDNSPPPRNPKLGYCVDRYIIQEISLTEPVILASAKLANQMDFSLLPDKIANATQDGIDKVAEALEQLKLAEQAAVDVEAASVIYRPIHKNVRGLQRDAKTFDRAIKGIKDRLDELLEGNSKIAGLKADIEELAVQKDALLAQIPSDWDETHKAFQEANRIEKKAFAIYRRLSSDAYTPAIETLDILNSGDGFRALEAAVMASKSIVTDNAPADAVEQLKQLARKFSSVSGAGDIKSAISKARRAVKSKTPDKEKALGELDKAIALYKAQLQWRAKAEAEITPKLEAYTESLKSTLGLREQKKFNRKQALFVASCASDHRDVSLNF
ncbi:MAG: TRAP transporter large permease subunit [Amylibacter sp.]|nr:TRAP transporter large permease subunit [Amylibacter sp.]